MHGNGLMSLEKRSGHFAMQMVTSACPRKRTYAVQLEMSALPPKADMCGALADVRYWPKADISPYSIISFAQAMSVSGTLNRAPSNLKSRQSPTFCLPRNQNGRTGPPAERVCR